MCVALDVQHVGGAAVVTYNKKITVTFVFITKEAFWFLTVLGFEFRVSCLLGLSHAFSPFFSGYFGDRVSSIPGNWGPPSFYFTLPTVTG
jgi:hypothetical protein